MTMRSGPWTLPGTWAWASIGEVADVVGGGTPKTAEVSNFNGGTVPWITPADLSGYVEKYIGRGARNITIAGLKDSAARLLPEGTVLFSSRAPIGYVAIAANPVATNQGFKSFILPPSLDPEYIYYYLQRARELAIGLASGTTFLEISGRKAATIPLAIAPYLEQRRIVEAIEAHLTRIDVALGTLERVLRNLERYRASVLKAAVTGRLVPTEAELARAEHRNYEPASVLLERVLAVRRLSWEETELAKMTAGGKPPKDDKWRANYAEPEAPDTSGLPELPEGWCWASPGQFFTWSSGDFLPKKSQHGGAIPVLGGNGVNGFHDQPLVYSPTLVVGRVGAQCGNVHLTDGPAWITDNAIYASTGSELAVLPYWQMVMSLEDLNANAGGTGQPYVNQKHLNDLVIPLPPEAEQRRIVVEAENCVSLADHVANEVRSSSERSQRLRLSVLKWAFEGRLVDQEPTDEPAAALLDRIRAERADASSAPRSALANRKSPPVQRRKTRSRKS